MRWGIKVIVRGGGNGSGDYVFGEMTQGGNGVV